MRQSARARERERARASERERESARARARERERERERERATQVSRWLSPPALAHLKSSARLDRLKRDPGRDLKRDPGRDLKRDLITNNKTDLDPLARLDKLIQPAAHVGPTKKPPDNKSLSRQPKP